MARKVKRLSDRTVRTMGKAGRHADGDGLYLIVEPSGSKRWQFLFRWQGKLKEMGLGSFASVSLAEARGAADQARRMVSAGRNPIEARREARVADAAVLTFGQVAATIVASLSEGFRNEKHRQQWTNTLSTYAAPLCAKAVAEISTADVLACLQPIWTTKPETASRVRGRIERVLDGAKAQGQRTGENPARWRGHLDNLLARRQRLTRGHHAAMPYADLPSFMADLRLRTGSAALALEFAILTVARSGEIYGARWGEIDRKAKVWTVPAARMKASREHRVPLCDRALAILDAANMAIPDGKTRALDDYVFPSDRRGKPLSVMAMSMLMRRMDRNVTVHGFRSSFRDWAGNETHFPREIAEAALAHVIGDKAEQAYRRGDALEKRRALMTAWSDYVGNANTGNNVVPISRTA